MDSVWVLVALVKHRKNQSKSFKNQERRLMYKSLIVRSSWSKAHLMYVCVCVCYFSLAVKDMSEKVSDEGCDQESRSSCLSICSQATKVSYIFGT